MKVRALHRDVLHRGPSHAWTRLRGLDLDAPCHATYPAPDRFVEAFDAASYRRWLRRRGLAGAGPLALHVHLPFCAPGCQHAACDSVVGRGLRRARDYLRQLGREVELLVAELGRGQPVSLMYWGGGTPNYFSADELAELADTIRARFQLRAGGDHAIEIDPQEAEPDLARRLAAMGFNRLVVGVPELDPGVLQAMGRVPAAGPTAEFMAEARATGFRSVGVALACGLPGQAPTSFAQTLERLIAMQPDRIILRDLGRPPQRCRNRRRLRADEPPSLAQLTALHACAHECLAAADYEFVGMGHFALPGDPLARAHRAGHLDWGCHGYSTQPEPELIGFGAAAISRVGASYSQNLRAPDEYADAVRQGLLPVARGIELDADDLVRRAVIHGLCGSGRVATESIEIAHLIDFGSYFAAEIQALGPWVDAGLVEVDPEWILVTPAGRRYLRAISACFDRYQRESARRASVDPIL